MRRELKVFTGSAHPALGEAIAQNLSVPLGRAHLARFSDGEVWFQIQDNVRGVDVFVVQPTGPPVNENLMELLVMLDAFKRSSASRITAVLPYYGYARQDRKDKPRVPISAKLVADLLSSAGTDRVLTMDLHSAQIQGFFNTPVDHLFAAPVIIDYISRLKLPRLTVVSPDAGGVERARAYAKRLDASLAIVDKRRERAGESEVMNIIGDVSGHDCILIDDIADSGGTLVNAAEALLKQGAISVTAYITHGVLSGGAVARVTGSKLKELVITDSIQPSEAVRGARNIRVLPIATLIGEAIGRTAAEESVSSLFD